MRPLNNRNIVVRRGDICTQPEAMKESWCPYITSVESDHVSTPGLPRFLEPKPERTLIYSSPPEETPLLHTIGKTSTEFVTFGRLPVELQLLIWEIARDSIQGRVHIWYSYNIGKGRPDSIRHHRGVCFEERYRLNPKAIATPALLHTCRMSRYVASKKYKHFVPSKVREQLSLNPSDRGYWCGDQDIIEIVPGYWRPGPGFHNCPISKSFLESRPLNLKNSRSARTLVVDSKCLGTGFKNFYWGNLVYDLGFPHLKELFITFYWAWSPTMTDAGCDYLMLLFGPYLYQMRRERWVMKCYDQCIVLKIKALEDGEQPLRISLMARDYFRPDMAWNSKA